MLKRFLIFALVLTFFSLFSEISAFAGDPQIAVPDAVLQARNSKDERCKPHQKATITIHLAKQAHSFVELNDYSEDVTQQALEHAEKLSITDFLLRNSSLTIQPIRRNYNYDITYKYEISGSLSFESEDLKKSIEYADAMSQKGFQVHYRESKNVPQCRY